MTDRRSDARRQARQLLAGAKDLTQRFGMNAERLKRTLQALTDLLTQENIAPEQIGSSDEQIAALWSILGAAPYARPPPPPDPDPWEEGPD